MPTYVLEEDVESKSVALKTADKYGETLLFAYTNEEYAQFVTDFKKMVKPPSTGIIRRPLVYLASDRRVLCWAQSPERKLYSFISANKAQIAAMKKEDFENSMEVFSLPIPRMMYILELDVLYKFKDLYVLFYPEGSTKYYLPYLHNVYNTSRVCMSDSAKEFLTNLNEPTLGELMDNVYETFWNSTFNKDVCEGYAAFRSHNQTSLINKGWVPAGGDVSFLRVLERMSVKEMNSIYTTWKINPISYPNLLQSLNFTDDFTDMQIILYLLNQFS